MAASRERFAQREADVERLQTALNGLEAESRQLGRSHSSDRHALELEIDRVRRDLERCEDELASANEDREAALRAARDGAMQLATAQSESRDLASQLASQTQTRLKLADKLDETSKVRLRHGASRAARRHADHDVAVQSLREARNDLTSTRDRLHVVEAQLSSDSRSLNKSEGQFRDQLTERNTLLLTVFQYVDKVAPPQARKPGQSDPKPFTNFKVFQDALMGRLKYIGQIQFTFDRRTREIEAKFTDKFGCVPSSLGPLSCRKGTC